LVVKEHTAMRKPISPSVLKALRERAGWSQKALADRAGISKDSLSRLERGTQTGAAERTKTTLAKVFNVAEGVLTGELEIPPVSGGVAVPHWEAPRDQWNIRVDSSVRNAFTLTAIRYKIPVTRIVDLAPLLFVLMAEQSLSHRRDKLAKLDEALDRLTEAAGGFDHLPLSINPGFEAHDAMAAEEASIKALDLLADKLDDDLFYRFGPQKTDYEPEEDNPFVSDLKEMVTRVTTVEPGLASISRFSREDVDYQVCGREALDLAGGDRELAKGILAGWAPIHEMRELLGPDRQTDRLLWLQQKKEEQEAAMARLWAELGIDDLPVGAGA
jgi:transcriptional regulator with XRE-family HTH domain